MICWWREIEPGKQTSWGSVSRSCRCRPALLPLALPGPACPAGPALPLPGLALPCPTLSLMPRPALPYPCVAWSCPALSPPALPCINLALPCPELPRPGLVAAQIAVVLPPQHALCTHSSPNLCAQPHMSTILDVKCCARRDCVCMKPYWQKAYVWAGGRAWGAMQGDVKALKTQLTASRWETASVQQRHQAGREQMQASPLPPPPPPHLAPPPPTPTFPPSTGLCTSATHTYNGFCREPVATLHGKYVRPQMLKFGLQGMQLACMSARWSVNLPTTACSPLLNCFFMIVLHTWEGHPVQ